MRGAADSPLPHCECAQPAEPRTCAGSVCATLLNTCANWTFVRTEDGECSRVDLRRIEIKHFPLCQMSTNHPGHPRAAHQPPRASETSTPTLGTRDRKLLRSFTESPHTWSSSGLLTTKVSRESPARWSSTGVRPQWSVLSRAGPCRLLVVEARQGASLARSKATPPHIGSHAGALDTEWASLGAQGGVDISAPPGD